MTKNITYKPSEHTIQRVNTAHKYFSDDELIDGSSVLDKLSREDDNSEIVFV